MYFASESLQRCRHDFIGVPFIPACHGEAPSVLIERDAQSLSVSFDRLTVMLITSISLTKLFEEEYVAPKNEVRSY